MVHFVDPESAKSLALHETVVFAELMGGAEDEPPLEVHVSAERAIDATRIRIRGVNVGSAPHKGPHDWWRRKSAAEAAVADAGPLVTVAFPDRSTAVLIVADNPPLSMARANSAAA